MLGYLFWHWPRSGVGLAEYEARLRAFHDALQGQLPAGMRRSLVWRVDGAPWLPSGPGYEDWYLVNDSAALDALNEGAVSGSVGTMHDRVAALAGGGTAGLYRAAEPARGAVEGSTACWFQKPQGTGYADMYHTLEDQVAGLWVRMMVLGPAPEFCLLADTALPGSTRWDGIVVQRSAIWP